MTGRGRQLVDRQQQESGRDPTREEDPVSVRAIVIGGGIGGAATALALTAAGLEVEVHEARPRDADHVGWVTLGPAAMTGLEQIGVAAEMWERGFPVSRIRSIDPVTGAAKDFARQEPGHRYSSTHVWRRDLLAALRRRLDDERITCYYTSSPAAEALNADLIVGADGAWSATRHFIGNHTEPSYTGQVIRYGHHPQQVTDLPPGVLHFWRHDNGTVGYVGDDRDGSFWFSRHNSDTPNAGLDTAVMLAPLRDTPVAAVLDDSWVGPCIALYELDPGGSWHSGNTLIIGDAAHAVSPAAGRGATSTIEDAIMLAKYLHSHDYDITAALDAFTADRRPIAQATFRPTPGERPTAATADQLDLSALRIDPRLRTGQVGRG
jgi:2-polyprenyl-6-methoxyphenol hydroxylase-like FAD-dependent oxidoreductase